MLEDGKCQFLLYEGATDALIQNLQRGNVPFIVASRAESEIGLLSTILFEQKLYLIDSAEKPFFSEKKLSLPMLAGKPMILHTVSSGMRSVTDGLFESCGCRPFVVGEASEDAVIAQMADMGVVTDSVEIRRMPGIRMIDLDLREHPRYIYLTRKKGVPSLRQQKPLFKN